MGSKLLLQLKQKHLDGLGAQTHRIISILAISNFLNANCKVDSLAQRDLGILVPEYTPAELMGWNNLILELLSEIQTPQDVGDVVFRLTFSPKHLLIALISARLLTLFLPLNICINISEPHAVTNRYPLILEKLKSKLCARKCPLRNEILNIVVHIRQGDVLLPQFSNRRVDISQYEQILSQVINSISESQFKQFEVSLITSPNFFGLGGSSIDQMKNQSYVTSDILPKIQGGNIDFSNLVPPINEATTPYLFSSTRIEGTNSFEDLNKLIDADVVIMSKSSFSYVGAFLNPRGIVICPEFWHPRLNSWLDPNHRNFEEVLQRQLEFLYENRSAKF